jgi:hypothetical protein
MRLQQTDCYRAESRGMAQPCQTHWRLSLDYFRLPCCAVMCPQHIDGYCAAPHSVCFSSAVLDESPLAAELLAEPTRIALPRTGLLKVRRALPTALLGTDVVDEEPCSCRARPGAHACTAPCIASDAGQLYRVALKVSCITGSDFVVARRAACCRCALLTCALCPLRRRR